MKQSLLPSLFLIVCLVGFPQISETIYTPSLPDLANSLGISMTQAEFTLSIYFIGFALGVFGWGILADLFGRRKSMLYGIVIYFLGSLGCRFSESIDALLICRFFQALGASAGSVVTQTIIRDLYDGKERNHVFSVISGALSLSPAVGPFIGGFVDQFFGWKANFSILAGMGVLLWMYSYVRLPETRKTNLVRLSASSIHSLAQRMFRDPLILKHAFLIGACNGIIFSYYAEAPYVFIEIMGLSPAQYGSLGLMVATTFFLSSKIYKNLSLKLNSDQISQLGAATSLAGSLLLTLASQSNLIHPSHGLIAWISLIGPLALIFLGIGILIPNGLSNALVQYKDQLGSAASIFGLIYYIWIALFTALMSKLHNGSTDAMAIYFLVLTLLMLGTSFLTHRRSIRLIFLSRVGKN